MTINLFDSIPAGSLAGFVTCSCGSNDVDVFDQRRPARRTIDCNGCGGRWRIEWLPPRRPGGRARSKTTLLVAPRKEAS